MKCSCCSNRIFVEDANAADISITISAKMTPDFVAIVNAMHRTGAHDFQRSVTMSPANALQFIKEVAEKIGATVTIK